MEKSLDDDVHADQSIIDRILEVMDRIEENLSQALATERSADAQREDDYQALTEKVNSQVSYITGQILDLKGVISVLEDRISKHNEKLSNAHDDAHNFEGDK